MLVRGLVPVSMGGMYYLDLERKAEIEAHSWDWLTIFLRNNSVPGLLFRSDLWACVHGHGSSARHTQVLEKETIYSRDTGHWTWPLLPLPLRFYIIVALIASCCCCFSSHFSLINVIIKALGGNKKSILSTCKTLPSH